MAHALLTAVLKMVRPKFTSIFIAFGITLRTANGTLRANAIGRVVAAAFARTFVPATLLIDHTLGDPWG